VIDAALLEKLKTYDTPTICNALEIVDPARRLTGFTVKPLVCPFPNLPPMVGYAKTATSRSTHAHELDSRKQREQRIAYYEYIAGKPAPGIVVIQDLDGHDVGFGAFWGEVMSAVHAGLGCLGVVTDGSIPATSTSGRRTSRRWPARSYPATPTCTSTTSAARCASPACWCALATWCTPTATAPSLSRPQWPRRFQPPATC
jgi:hypothetical protein